MIIGNKKIKILKYHDILSTIKKIRKLLRDFFLMSKHSIIYSNKINEKS